MTPFKNRMRLLARASVVASVGSLSRVGPGAHILAGHNMAGGSREVFERQLDGLSSFADLVDIRDAVEMIQSKRTLHRPTVSFTFDDGFADWASIIAPALEARGVGAAFFLSPGLVDLGNSPWEEFNRKLNLVDQKPITSGQVRRLAESGHVVGSHTVNHTKLVGLSDDDIDREVRLSKRMVAELTGQPCDWFAWTYGGFDHIDSRAINVALEEYEVVFSSAGYPNYSTLHPRVLNRRHVEPYWRPQDARFFMRRARK